MAQLINPAFGSSFSFPWKRGPHDQLIEHGDAVKTFENIRMTAYKNLSEFDFGQCLVAIYDSEIEEDHTMTKMAVLRIVTQLTRIKREALNSAGHF